MQFRTTRIGEEVRDPSTGKVLGTETKETGVVKVTVVEKEYAKAKILKDRGGIAVGDGVEEVPAQTRFGIGIGYTLAGLKGAVNKRPGSIRYQSSFGVYDTLALDYSDKTYPSFLHSFFISVDYFLIFQALVWQFLILQCLKQLFYDRFPLPPPNGHFLYKYGQYGNTI